MVPLKARGRFNSERGEKISSSISKYHSVSELHHWGLAAAATYRRERDNCHTMVCPSKILRNKRRLLSFLLRKLEQKEKIIIDIFELSSALFNKTKHLLKSNNALIFPEARFVNLIATFQNSFNFWPEVQCFLQKDVLRQKVKQLNIFKCSTELLSTHLNLAWHLPIYFKFL